MHPWLARLQHLPQQILIGLVRGYRLLLSPWLGSTCRFEPTCSRYALGVLERHGAAAGSVMTVHRLLRCHPWCAGGHDPVPENPPRWFTRLLGTAPAPASPSSSDSTVSTSTSP
jgi:putative membrane protein insertion efficiency factor